MTNGVTNLQIKNLQSGQTDNAAKLDILRTQTLPDLQAEVVSLKTRINILSAINIGSIILGIIAAHFLK